jgi:hypothetical protein
MQLMTCNLIEQSEKHIFLVFIEVNNMWKVFTRPTSVTDFQILFRGQQKLSQLKKIISRKQKITLLPYFAY